MNPDQIEEFLKAIQEVEVLQEQVSILKGKNERLLNEVMYQRELLDKLPALFEDKND
jgi:hypothetical protein|tara:strand:+ start:299 stop:469 length:171 start_codon:yes stop_codon:yes gene_type:complete